MLLQRVDQSAVVREPFPHVVIENALDDELCRQLVREFPALPTARGRTLPEAHKVLFGAADRTDLSEAWRTMVAAVHSPAMFAEIIRLLGDEVLREYPDFARRHGPLDLAHVDIDQPAGVRPLTLGCQFGVCTPVRQGFRAERGAYIKGPDKLIECTLFLRADGDEAPGGELELFSVRPGFRPTCGRRNQVPAELLQLVRSVPYRRNTLVLFINTPRSIQQIAVRGPGRRPLQFFDIHLKVRQPLFALPTDENVSARRPGGGWRSFSKFLRGSVTAP